MSSGGSCGNESVLSTGRKLSAEICEEEIVCCGYNKATIENAVHFALPQSFLLFGYAKSSSRSRVQCHLSLKLMCDLFRKFTGDEMKICGTYLRYLSIPIYDLECVYARHPN